MSVLIFLFNKIYLITVPSSHFLIHSFEYVFYHVETLCICINYKIKGSNLCMAKIILPAYSILIGFYLIFFHSIKWSLFFFEHFYESMETGSLLLKKKKKQDLVRDKIIKMTFFYQIGFALSIITCLYFFILVFYNLNAFMDSPSGLCFYFIFVTANLFQLKDPL